MWETELYLNPKYWGTGLWMFRVASKQLYIALLLRPCIVSECTRYCTYTEVTQQQRPFLLKDLMLLQISCNSNSFPFWISTGFSLIYEWVLVKLLLCGSSLGRMELTKYRKLAKHVVTHFQRVCVCVCVCVCGWGWGVETNRSVFSPLSIVMKLRFLF